MSPSRQQLQDRSNKLITVLKVKTAVLSEYTTALVPPFPLATNPVSSPLQCAEQKIWKMQNSMDGTSWRNQVSLSVLVPPQCTATLKLLAWPCMQVNNFCLLTKENYYETSTKG